MTDTQEQPQPARDPPAFSALLKDPQLQPLLVFAGALALGFLFSRVVRTPDPRHPPSERP